jgi:hypothetical protein
MSAPSITVGAEQAETISVTVSSSGGTPTGTVTVTAGTAKVCTITLAAGAGSCVLQSGQLPAGTYQVTASYGGDANTDPSASPPQTLTVLQGQAVTVSSTSGWQQVPVGLTPGEAYTVSYISGTWTVDQRNYPKVGPGGYSNAIDQTIYQGCKYDPNVNYAVLLGEAGALPGTDFPVRQGGIFYVPSGGGPLYLRINDDDACLGDNAGSVTMFIVPVYPEPSPSYAGYSAHAANDAFFTLAEATWVVPSISSAQCLGNVSSYPRAGIWAGLFGNTSTAAAVAVDWLPQIGTISQCNVGPTGLLIPGPNYWAFWEMETNVSGGGAQGYGAGPQYIPSLTISPGDTITALVEYKGKTAAGLLTFYYELFDQPPGQQATEFHITVTTTKQVAFENILRQGGAMVEPNCTSGLAQFGSVKFTHVQLASSALPGITQPQGIGLNKWTMSGTNGAKLAQTGTLTGFPGAMSYTINYSAQGPVPSC